MNRTKPDLILVFFCSLIFLIPTIFKVQGSEFTIEELIVGIDDWNRYARYAIDINKNGLLIESINGNYVIPAGFLYNYFIALSFSIFGESPAIVYCIQSILLGSSVALSYFTFRDFLRPKTAWLFLLFLIVFAYFDIYKYYTFRLLSENLALFTITLFFFFLKKIYINRTYTSYIVAAILIGGSVLIRPNILPYSLIIAFLLFLFNYTNKKYRIHLWSFLLIYVLVLAILPIRNFLVSGDLTTMFIDKNFLDYLLSIDKLSPNNSGIVNEHSASYGGHYFKKLIFCFGYLPILELDYKIRPHWIVMWTGFISYLFFLILQSRKIKRLEISLLLYVLSFYLVIILTAPITNYGFRFLIPVLFFVLGFSFIGFEKLYKKVTTLLLKS